MKFLEIENAKNIDEFLDQFKNQKIHLLGISSQEIRSICDYLIYKKIRNLVLHDTIEQKDFEKNFISLDDSRTKLESKKMLSKIKKQNFIWQFKEKYGQNIKQNDLVIVSQAYFRYPANKKIIDLANKNEICLTQAIELVFKISPGKIIGITGTVGKSTVTEMIKTIFETAKKPFYHSGNDRENKWDLIQLSKMSKKSWSIIEVSNRHLKNLKQSPHIGILTNLFPHHLDDHGSFKKYIFDKTNIFRFQNHHNYAILNQEIIDEKLLNLKEFDTQIFSFKVRPFKKGEDFSKRSISLILNNKRKEIIKVLDLYLPSEHIAKNALAAAMAANFAGIKPLEISKGLKNYKGLKYRIQYLGKIKNSKVYNDGKSSDPIGTISAIKSIPEKKILIMGGVREGIGKSDFKDLAEIIKKENVKKVFVYGKSRNAIKGQILKSGFKDIKVISNFDQAVKEAFQLLNNETIIFSPACQSFDQFKDYRERAEKFNQIFKKYSSK